jgi:hypothetical protein
MENKGKEIPPGNQELFIILDKILRLRSPVKHGIRTMLSK